jgi:hypothetical protein
VDSVTSTGPGFFVSFTESPASWLARLKAEVERRLDSDRSRPAAACRVLALDVGEIRVFVLDTRGGEGAARKARVYNAGGRLIALGQGRPDGGLAWV